MTKVLFINKTLLLILFIILFFLIVLSFGKQSKVYADSNVTVSANVYSCDFNFQIIMDSKPKAVNSDYSTLASIKFSSPNTNSLNINIPINNNGTGYINLCNNNIFFQGGKYDVTLYAYAFGYKKLNDVDLFKTYSSSLNMNLDKSDLESNKACNDINISEISPKTDNNSNTSLPDTNSTFSKDNLPLSALVVFYPLLFRKKKIKEYNNSLNVLKTGVVKVFKHKKLINYD